MSLRNGAFAPEGLDSLLQKDSEAKQYFSALPEYIQQMIEERGTNVHSAHELQRYAENLLEGDK